MKRGFFDLVSAKAPARIPTGDGARGGSSSTGGAGAGDGSARSGGGGASRDAGSSAGFLSGLKRGWLNPILNQAPPSARATPGGDDGDNDDEESSGEESADDGNDSGISGGGGAGEGGGAGSSAGGGSGLKRGFLNKPPNPKSRATPAQVDICLAKWARGVVEPVAGNAAPSAAASAPQYTYVPQDTCTQRLPPATSQKTPYKLPSPAQADAAAAAGDEEEHVEYCFISFEGLPGAEADLQLEKEIIVEGMLTEEPRVTLGGITHNCVFDEDVGSTFYFEAESLARVAEAEATELEEMRLVNHNEQPLLAVTSKRMRLR